MENDSIRSSGSNTLVDIWIDGKMRSISVSKEAIGAYLGFDRSGPMSEDDRREFVRTHLPLLITAAKNRLIDTDPAADTIIIDTGQLPRRDGQSGDRRKGDRRKTERRKGDAKAGDRPERRRADRRQGQRRTKSTGPKES